RYFIGLREAEMSSTLSVCMLSSDEDEKENENTNVVDDDNEGNSSSVEESADEDDASDAYNLEEPENNGEVKSVEDTDSEAETAELTIDVPDSKLIQANLVVSEAKTFSELGLSRWVCEQLRQLSVKLPTPVQANCIPHILAGSDVLGCAKTGTGKTLAFALPILNQLAVDPFGIYALVLTPTRELAFQIAEQFVALGARIGLKTTVIVGGRDQVEQAKNLARRPHIVVATPGRLADHISSEPEGIAKLFKKMHFLVLDEADRLLDGQYGEQLKTIFSALSTKRQTLLFSATINSALNHLQQVSVRKPYLYEDKSGVATVDRLDQKYVLCPNAVKDAYLVYVVKNFHQNRPDSSILIFSHTCRECQALAIMFTGLGFQVGSLHSQISQQERLSSLIRFRCGRIRILICTDVAARGLDIPHVDLVVSHNVPRSPKTYVHRVGRSARAGRFGGAITFVTQYDITLLHEVEKLVGKKLDRLNVPDKKVTQHVTQVLVTKREAEVKLDQQNFGERKRINKRKAMLDPEEVDEKLREEHTKRKAKNQHQ
uniref:RNA helicase n=2 Tax=Parascaris univalens TaxID=6257 RepID=A0A915AR27_PARUN